MFFVCQANRGAWNPSSDGNLRMDITRTGSQLSGNGPAEWCTGTVRIAPLLQPKAPVPVSGAGLTFEPGARTARHTCSLGQPPIATAGCG